MLRRAAEKHQSQALEADDVTTARRTLDRLLAIFLPRAFRRPVDAEVRQVYVAKVEERLKAGNCFEFAMRWAYRAALCSPDFLYLVEHVDHINATSCRTI